MSKYYKLGDKIEIKYKVDDIELIDTSTITYYHQDGYILHVVIVFQKMRYLI